MNEIKDVARGDRCPGLSYTDMLNGDTRRPPDYLFAESHIEMGDEPVPVAPYISEAFAQAERERMWPNVWLFAAREDEMPDPGDSVVFDIAGKSFLLIRQKDGGVKAFYNACLHRGRKLRTESGASVQLRCPFHGFTWRNDGSLKEIPCAWDFKHLEGKEMSLHVQVATATGMPVFFADPHSPWQRGTNENTNGLIREYFPKGTDLSIHDPEELAYVAAEINARPRKRLNWETPAEVFQRLLSEPGSVANTP